MKPTLIIFISCVLVLGIIAVLICFDNSSTIESYIASDVVPIVEVALCHAQGGETDYFALTEDGEFIVERGVRQGKDLKNRPFIVELSETQKYVLTPDEVNNIINLTGKVYQNPTDVECDISGADITEIQILYNGSLIIEEEYKISPEIEELLSAIAKISPIEIGYLHSLLNLPTNK